MKPYFYCFPDCPKADCTKAQRWNTSLLHSVDERDLVPFVQLHKIRFTLNGSTDRLYKNWQAFITHVGNLGSDDLLSVIVFLTAAEHSKKLYTPQWDDSKEEFVINLWWALGYFHIPFFLLLRSQEITRCMCCVLCSDVEIQWRTKL